MDKNVHPAVAVIVIFLAAFLISLYVWAQGAETDVGGADQVQQDAQGNVYVHVSDTLYKFSPSFELLSSYELSQYGVQDMVGDFAFFANGDILIRQGKYDPGFLESIFRFLRYQDRKQPVAKNQDEGLARCNLETGECHPFGESNLDFDIAFHLSIDTATDTVYVSDTSRSTLRKFDASGREIAKNDDNFHFPNQIMLDHGQLLVADTNHHAIRVLEISDDKFAEIVTSHRLKTKTRGKNWVFSFARVGEHWWVNHMDAGMSDGEISVYNDQWKYQETIGLPDDADPIDILALADRVIVTDLANSRIYQLDSLGKILDKPLPQQLQDKLNLQLQAKQRYHTYATVVLVGFIGLLVIGFGVAIFQGFKEPEPKLDWSDQEKNLVISDPAIEWIKKDPRKIRSIKLLKYLPGLMGLLLLLPLLIPGEHEQQYPVAFVVSLLFVFVAASLHMNRFLSTELGVKDDLLIIRNGLTHEAGKGQNIFYSNLYIVVGNLWVSINPNSLLFDTEQMVQKVMPRLQHATYVTPGKMMAILMRRQKKTALVSIIGIVLVVVAMLISFP